MTSVPLKRLAAIRVSNVDKKSVDGGEPVRLCNYTDVYSRDIIRPDQDLMSATASHEQVSALRLKSGDVIITKDSETVDDIGVPSYVEAGARDLICGYHLAIIRPVSSQIDGRFLFWSMVSTTVRDQFSVTATGVTRYGLRTDSIGGVMITCPSVRQQGAIADFLDAETAHIDALIARKRQLAAVVGELMNVLAEQVMWGSSPKTMPLMYRTDPARPIMYGIVLPGPDVPDGVPIVKGGDVAGGRLSTSQLCRTASDIEVPYARARLRSGDLLFAIRGGIGDVQVVPPDLEGANITQDVARIAPCQEVDSWWLKLVLETVSLSLKAQIAKRTTGATIRGLNICELKRVRIPWSDPSQQRRDLEVLSRL